MQKWKSAPLFITCLLCTGILLTASARDQGPCQPQAPFLQVQVTPYAEVVAIQAISGKVLWRNHIS